MTTSHEAELDRYFEKFEKHLPDRLNRAMHWLRQPSSFYVRILVSVLLIFGGIFSFLPILGLWMLPLGLIFIAQDLPFLRPPLIAVLKWIESKFEKRQKNRETSKTPSRVER